MAQLPEFIRILMKRDNLDDYDVISWLDDYKEEFQDIIESGNILELEELIRSDFGLEPDYVMDFVDYYMKGLTI